MKKALSVCCCLLLFLSVFALPAGAAKNDVREGIATTAVLIAGRRVRAERSRCPSLQKEIHGYLWDARAAARGEERPVKEHDHAMDALRYLCHTCTSRFRRAGGRDG